MKDLFKQAIEKETGIGGWKCSCCCPIATGPKNRGRMKAQLHQRARSRMKQGLYKIND
jgi:hypothetical protein